MAIPKLYFQIFILISHLYVYSVLIPFFIRTNDVGFFSMSITTTSCDDNLYKINPTAITQHPFGHPNILEGMDLASGSLQHEKAENSSH